MTVEGCGSESLQGDVRFAEIMQEMGATVKWQPHEIVIEGLLFIPYLAYLYVYAPKKVFQDMAVQRTSQFGSAL